MTCSKSFYGVYNMTPTASALKGALTTYLHDRIAQDAKMPNLVPVVRDVTRANFSQLKSRIAARVRLATRGKLAYDSLDLDDLQELLDMLEEHQEGESMDRRRRARDEEEDDDNPNLNGEEHMEEPEEPDDEGEDEEFSGGSYGSREPSRYNNMESVADAKRRAADKRKRVMDKMRRAVEDARRARDEDLDEEGEDYDRVRAARDRDNEMSNVADPSEVTEGEDRAGRRRYSMDSANGFFKRFPSARRIDNSNSWVAETAESRESMALDKAAEMGSGKSFADRFPSASRIKNS